MVLKIIDLSLRQRAVVLLATLVLIGVGVWSALRLPIDAVPDITNPQVLVNTAVPALAPEEIEKLVTLPLESQMAGLPGMMELRSLSKFGLSQIRMTFEDDVDLYRIRQLVSERLLVAASDGRGFLVRAADTIAETRKGKTVVTPRAGARLKLVRPVGARDDYVAVVGDNRKLLVFPLSEVAELARGQGVQLQRYRDGGLSDARTFVLAEGLSWAMGGEARRQRTESDLTPWRAARGAAGRMPPNGFPRDNRF